MRKLAGFIASWRLTAFLLLVLGAVYAAFSFGKNPWPAWAAFVLRTPAGLALLSCLIVNQLAVSARIIIGKLSRKPFSSGDIRMMDGHITIPSPEGGSLDRLASWMRTKGFEPVRSGDTLHAVSGKLSFIPGTLFRLGLALFFVSLLLSTALRRSEHTVLHEGESLSSFGRTVTLASVRTDLPEDFLQVGEDDTLRLENVIALFAMDGSTRTVGSRSPERMAGLYYRIVHMGYAQPAAIKGLRRPFSGTLDLDILPPGKSAVLSLPDDDRFLTVSLEPERTITKGILKGRQFDLKAPRYRFIVQRGSRQREANALVLRRGETGAAGGLLLSLGKSSVYVTLEIVRDPALIWIRTGLLLALSGLALLLSRLFWYEKRLCAVLEGDVVRIGYSEEFYRKWGIARLYDWKAELEAMKRP